MKILLISIFFLFSIQCYSQDNIKTKINFKGLISSKEISNDSIFFIGGEIDNKYYDEYILASSLNSNEFKISTELSYPHMYRVVFKSDENKILYRSGVFFIDSTTTIINIDYNLEECIQQDGYTSLEYYNNFIPHITTKSYKCDSDEIYNLATENTNSFDSLLLNYVKKSPDSYVALWFLNERFNMFGHSILRQYTLEAFSPQIKNNVLWKSITKELNNSQIKINSAFPEVILKDYNLNTKKIKIPSKDYVLIDFWWSRCKPCIEAFPSLLKIYNEYKDRGFDIVGISVDREKDIKLWKESIEKYNLDWIHYLDINGDNSKKLAIKYFPSNLLLDKKSNVLYKDITTSELEKLLLEHYVKK